MAEGWLLDVTEGRDGASVVLWLKDGVRGTITRRVEPFLPPFWVDGARTDLLELSRELEKDPRIAGTTFEVLRPSLYDRRPRRILSVTTRRNLDRRRVATTIDARGGYTRFHLYDVDLTPPHLYHLEHQLYPFAPVRWSAGAVVALEPAETIDYALPPLTGTGLEVELRGCRRDGFVRGTEPISAVRLGDVTLEGPEEALLAALREEVVRQDPDLLLTDGGDGGDIPWLYRRAHAVGFTEETFFLGREPARFQPTRAAFSYQSYGKVEHREAAFVLPGRFHVDRGNSFLWGDAAVPGLIEAARLSRLSLQTVARQSPGTCFTAMEMAHAREEGVHIPWKKNRPEAWKSGRRLLEGDRGGVIFQPPVGVHDHVDEFDFASLYPHIMVRQNLSAETLDCRCCPMPRRRAPGLGYRSCDRRVGLIPRTLEPLLVRRLAYKARLRQPGLSPLEREILQRRVKMLKWILVTAFGYQGYRNARFGRIECHESINAYARELLAGLLHRAERSGYRVIHGIVDSLWVQPLDPAHPPDPEEFAATMSREFDLPLGYEGRYRWIVFLPAVTHGLGVPNRYYGLYSTGEFKLRGIGSRRHDTPVLLRRFEGELLQLFGRARTAEEFRAAVPRALARADAFAARIQDGTWPREELLIARRIVQELGAYVTFSDSVAALRQLAHHGIVRAPGETVRYLVADRTARSWRDRVVVAEALAGDEPYDPVAYLELLARSAETLLAPMGVRREMLLLRWGISSQKELGRYRSPESLDQRRLDDRIEEMA
ncbi:MAG TPA: DNA polymerase domain-containing protein [Thermoplasmata archaeon]|nr:DNA polymerase domain-containing protein [Thermoplasmata archaeon]